MPPIKSENLFKRIKAGKNRKQYTEQEEVQISKEELEAAEAFGNTREDIEAFKKAQAGK